jgi:molybdate transport system regulatory protein
MTRRANVVSDQDLALLRSLERERSVVAASRQLGISRDRAVYRLERLRRAVGGPVVASVRGGSGHGGTRLTELGHRVARRGFDSVELVPARSGAALASPNRLSGIYRRDPTPVIELDRGLRLRVAFDANDGERVGLRLDPEAVLVARRRFATSARNVLRGTVESIRPAGPLGRTLVLRVGDLRLRAAVTAEPIRQLGIAPGASVYLYVKATALRRAPVGRG